MINRFPISHPLYRQTYRKSAVPCKRLFSSTLLIGHVRHLNQILLICSCACIVGYPMTF